MDENERTRCCNAVITGCIATGEYLVVCKGCYEVMDVTRDLVTIVGAR